VKLTSQDLCDGGIQLGEGGGAVVVGKVGQGRLLYSSSLRLTDVTPR